LARSQGEIPTFEVMGHRPTVFVVTRSVSLPLARAAVAIGVVLLVTFIWFVLIAPALASLSLAALLAIGWCKWLEGSAGDPQTAAPDVKEKE
jgi:hypothetical protein